MAKKTTAKKSAKKAAKSEATAPEVVTETPTTEPVVFVPTKMDPRVKKLWVADLRSGEYTQAKSYLRTTYKAGPKAGEAKGHCCLGVLSERFLRSKANTDKLKFEEETDTIYKTLKGGEYQEVTVNTGVSLLDGVDGLPPIVVCEWAGLNTSIQDAEVPVSALRKTKAYATKLDKSMVGGNEEDKVALAELNDSGFTFAQIADIIEECL